MCKNMAVLGITIGVIFASLTASAAAAADTLDTPDALETEVSVILAENPGGVSTSPHTIAWDDGAIVLTLDTGITMAAVGSCPTGSFCVYDGASLTGSRVAFSACSTYNTGTLPGSVRSIANARSTGYVQGRNSSGGTLTTVYAGAQVNSAPTGISQIACFG